MILIIGSLQKSKAQTIEEDTTQATSEVLGIVNFFKYLLNTVGSSKSITRDKEVIINESFKKAFLDENVQIEDDLTNDRKVITNKEVTAYLRDVDFFFENIAFSFDQIEVTKELLGEDGFYYLVSLECIIQGTTLDGELYERRSPRFIEINFDEANEDLKIASVYTTKVSREEELRNWWSNLPKEWIQIFESRIVVEDSLTKESLLFLGDIDSLDISNNHEILTLEPIEALRELKHLNISGTRIVELNPIRTAVHLQELNISETLIDNIEVLQYFNKLQDLDISNTNVMDISVLSKLTRLRTLNLSGVKATTFYSLNGLLDLEVLDLSYTVFSQTDVLAPLSRLINLDLSNSGIERLKGLGNLNLLQFLDCSETYISSVDELHGLKSLQEVAFKRTNVSMLSPLADIKTLTRINADYSGVLEARASDFMTKNKSVVVITNSEKVMSWWLSLSQEYQDIFARRMGVSKEPTKVDLIKLLNIDTLDLNGLRLLDGTPLSKFKKLEYLNISKNLFVNIDFIADMKDLRFLFATNLPVESFAPLAKNRKLECIVVNGSLVKNIGPLQRLSSLKLLDISDTEVTEDQVFSFLGVNPESIIIYRSDELSDWWENLSTQWKKVFDLSKVNALELHRLTQMRSITIENTPVTTLAPLKAFINLLEVNVSYTQVQSLSELNTHEHLVRIVCNNGPLVDIEGIERHRELSYLDVSNTAVDDLRPLARNFEIEELDASGTGIKHLKGLEQLNKLKSLNISNTRVWQLDRLYDIRTLKSMTCYNTRIRSNKILEFKENFPTCEVNYY